MKLVMVYRIYQLLPSCILPRSIFEVVACVTWCHTPVHMSRVTTEPNFALTDQVKNGGGLAHVIFFQCSKNMDMRKQWMVEWPRYFPHYGSYMLKLPWKPYSDMIWSNTSCFRQKKIIAIGPLVSEISMFESVYGQAGDGSIPYYKLGSGELKQKVKGK